MKALILAYFLANPVHPTDAAQTAEYRDQRLGDIAEGIVLVANGDKMLAAQIAVQFVSESGLRRDVQNCSCGPHECDHGLAFGLPQGHRWPTDSWMFGPAPWCGETVEHNRLAAERSATLFRGVSVEEGFRKQGGDRAKITDSWVISRARRARELAARL